MKKNTAPILIGIVFLSVAAVLTGNMMGWWNITSFPGWWTLFIIIPGLASLINNGFSIGGTIVTAIGVLLLANVQGWLEFIPKEVFWIAVFAFIGVFIIVKAVSSPKQYKAPVTYNNFQGQNPIDYSVGTAVFTESKLQNNSQNFIGGNLTAVFASVKLDASTAICCNGATIAVTSIFGGVEIIAPQYCRVITSGTPIFGGIKVIKQNTADPNAPVLKINYTTIFGGIKIY